jgi:hypothetical protein
MEVQDPRIRSLLRQADRVAESGKRAAAAGLYRQIIEEAPDTAVAWLGLAQMTADSTEREEAYQRILTLDPENEAALAALRPSDSPTVASAQEQSLDGRVQEDDFAAYKAWMDEALGGKARQKDGENAVLLENAILQENGILEEKENAPALDDPESEQPPVSSPEVIFCANHPRVETSLRCNKCGKPICSKCAKLTPVGYRCPECIREREDVFFNATPADYIIAAVTGLILGGIFSFIVPWIGFFALFVAPLAGGVTGKIALKLIGRRRGRWLPMVVTFIFVIAALPAIVIYLSSGAYFGIGFYLLIAPGALYYALK